MCDVFIRPDDLELLVISILPQPLNVIMPLQPTFNHQSHKQSLDTLSTQSTNPPLPPSAMDMGEVSPVGSISSHLPLTLLMEAGGDRCVNGVRWNVLANHSSVQTRDTKWLADSKKMVSACVCFQVDSMTSSNRSVHYISGLAHSPPSPNPT